MLNDYLNLQFDVKGKTFKGFCMRIHDDFHLTYAVILEDCHSFCIWLDDKTSLWRSSKFTNLDAGVLDQIIDKLVHKEETNLLTVS
ncbi:hypothetical protein [Pedobacter sp. Hv1]|uniref:hypothetical protein n=1 Tax=Pedobacter sp. Hv1 TaxID=1740090 RepID=UPI0006D8D4BA|nr:hypothetical protein [Pedobacter sp. Hv1]KQC00629.1 hypothetical protein AQF98_08055 [Pedobacter sp. Hv1]